MKAVPTMELRRMALTCPFCGHVRRPDDFMSWCDEHGECLCPKCGTCPETDVDEAVCVSDRQRPTVRTRQTMRRMAVALLRSGPDA